jgi:hypothetical protein
MKKPNFFIVGAPKCGTTAMDAFLGEHPEIYMSPVKELHYFGSDLKFHTPRIKLDDYLLQFKNAKNEKRIGESSVWYLYSKQAALEIKKFSPSASIIIMLRNPVDMIYSQHSQLLYEGYEAILDFESAIGAEDRRKKPNALPPLKDTSIELLFYRETAKYTRQIQRYLNIFGKENIHIIIYDDLKNNPAAVYKETLKFLKVPNLDFTPEFRIVNPNKCIRSKAFQHLIKSPDHGLRKFIKRFIPPKLRKTLLESAHKLNTYSERRAPLSLAIKSRLQEEFAEEIENLSIMLMRDMSFWLGKD